VTTPPEPPPSGAQREDQAAAAGAEAAAAIAEATATIIAVMAATIAAVAAGTMSVAAARRKVRGAVSGALGGASRKLRGIFARAAAQASAGGEEAGRPKKGGRPAEGPRKESGHGKAKVPGLPPVPDAPKAIAEAILTAQQDAGQAFEAAMYAALGGKGGPLRPAPGPYRDVVERAMRRLTGIGEDVKDLTGAERAKQSLSRLQAAQVVMNELASRGLTGFTDAAGRRWELGAYAEMSTRAAASRMHLSSQLSMMAQAGNRLVIVDNPSMEAPCPRCRPFEGTVVALYGSGSGSATITDAGGTKRTEKINGTLAEAVAAGLMHPNCRHSLIPWTDGAGAVATAGGKERGYVEGGKAISRSLPIGTPADYVNEQRLRAHERAVRRDHARLSAAITPQARARARLHLAASRQALEGHVKRTGVTRLKGRERPGKAR
jgi:hypothetical protein